jgi:2-keto-3-deoxy-L-rhamnonate aldolase RhmA
VIGVGRTPRRLAAALDRGGPALCLCLSQARTPDVVLIAAASGFDAVYVDLEHGVTPLDVTSMLCTTALGAGLFPLVRVPSPDAPMITRVLDGGALGVIVPHVDTAVVAEQVVDACRFPPVGRRTPYAATPATGYQSLATADLITKLDGEVLVAPMIESAQAVDNADDIAAVDGVDLLLVGAHDLSIELGVPGDVGHPDVRKAIDAAASAAHTHDRRWGVAGITDPQLLGELADQGLAFVSAGSDAGLLQQATTARVVALRTQWKDGTR